MKQTSARPPLPFTTSLRDRILKLCLAAIVVFSAAQVRAAAPIPVAALARDQGAGGLWADAVISYDHGVGFAVAFGTGLGYTNAPSILGAPARITPGDFGGPVDPFSPPYLREQLLSIGAGGSVTLRMGEPIVNDAAHRFGLDFLVFGNTGFVITNSDFTGGGITDGSLFSAGQATTRISVSQDGETFFRLVSGKAPELDGLFPTDGLGDIHTPVDPSLSNPKFTGQGLAGIRSLYAGSAGGAGYDLDWAVDGSGARVRLDQARYIRIETLLGNVELDAVTAVPEPSATVLALGGAVLMWRIARPRKSN